MDSPTFLFIGAEDCGANYLVDQLSKHPNVFMPKNPNVQFFNIPTHFVGDPAHEEAYRSNFITNKANVTQTGEASPVYCYLPEAMNQIYKFNPRIKLLMLVRDPVWRAISHYNKELSSGREKLSLEDAIKNEPRRHRTIHSYCARGYYSKQLDHIYELFSPKQVKVLRYEDMSFYPQRTFEEVTRFLEIPRKSITVKVNCQEDYPTPSSEEIQQLASRFTETNKKLQNVYGVKTSDWTK